MIWYQPDKGFVGFFPSWKKIENIRILINIGLNNNILPKCIRSLSNIVEIIYPSLDKCFPTIKGRSEQYLISESNRELIADSQEQNSSYHPPFTMKIILLRISDYI